MKHTEICKSMLHRLACATVACTVAVSFTAAAFAQTGDGAQQKTSVMQPIDAPAAAGLTPQQIAAGLGSARNYGVVAVNLQNDMHVECNLAVETLTGSEFLLRNSTFTEHMNLNSFPVALTLHATGEAGREYQFGIYHDAAGTSAASDTASLTMDETGSASKTVTLPIGQYYVMPLLEDGKPDAAHSSPVSISSEDSAEKQAGSYVGAFGEPETNQVTLEHMNLTVGSGEISGTENQKTLISGGKTIQVNLNSGSTVKIAAENEKVDVAGILNSLSGLASTLNSQEDNLSENAAVKVLNLSTDGTEESIRTAIAKALNFKDAQNDINNKGLPLNAGQYMVVNVKPQAGVTSIVLPKMTVNGQESQWNEISSRILWNFGSYSGTISKDNLVFTGTLLAPNATVDFTSSGNTNGAIYANTVKHSGAEFHRIVFQTVTPEDVYFAEKKEGSSSSESSAVSSEVVVPSSSSQVSSSEKPSEESSSVPSHGNGSSSSNSSSASSSGSSSSNSSSASSSGSSSSNSSSASSSGSSSSNSSSVSSSGSSSSNSSSASSSGSSSSSSSSASSSGSSSSNSSSASSPSAPSEENSSTPSHGNGSSSSSNSSSYPYNPPIVPSSIPSSSSTASSKTPSQESSSTPSNGVGESSTPVSSEMPSQESSSKPSNGAGTVSSTDPSVDPSTPVSNGDGGQTASKSGKLPQTGADVVPILVTFAGGTAVILYGIIEMIHGRGKKKHE